MRLTITKDNLHWDIMIVALSAQRRPAKEAALLYEEDPESHAKRQQQIIDEREMRALMPNNGPDHRPNKKQRRMIHRFKQDF
jgi:ribosome-associated heat shock protein Hsp15